MADDENPVLGRGRGRGIPRPADARDGSSSNSEKRLLPEKNGNGFGNAGQKRGNSRGDQRGFLGLIKTKPESAQGTKEGTTGRQVTLKSNYFRLMQKPTFEFRHYRVDFTPEIDHSGMRKAFIRSQEAVLGGHLFDGASILYLTKRLPDQITVFDVVSREGTNYKMTIKDTDVVIQMTDGMAVQVLNTILKRAMDGLNMQLVGRNMYDAKAPVNIPQYKIDLWPGKILHEIETPMN
jgi:aubergine